MLKKISLALISLYQKYISPYKGFKCAHGMYTSEITCSSYGKKVISKFGLFTGLKLLNRRFIDCRWSSEKLKKENKINAVSDYKRYIFVGGKRINQNGDCDCGGCDIAGDIIPDCGSVDSKGNSCISDVCDISDLCDWGNDNDGKKSEKRSAREKRNEKKYNKKNNNENKEEKIEVDTFKVNLEKKE